MLEGALALVVAARRRGRGYGWLFGLEGVLGIAVGLCAFAWPGLTAFVPLVFIAVWAILTGVVEVAAAIQLRRVVQGEWVLGLAGVLSIYAQPVCRAGHKNRPERPVRPYPGRTRSPL